MSFDSSKITMTTSLKQNIMCFAGAAMHITFFTVFLIFKIYMLMTFNIFSVLIYVIVGLLGIKKKSQMFVIGTIVVLFAEVCVHGILCTVMLGVDACFFLYLMMTLPTAMYFLSMTVDKELFMKMTKIFTVITIASLFISIYLVQSYGTFYENIFKRVIPFEHMRVIQMVNILFNLFLIVAFTVMFHWETRTLIDRLNSTNEQLGYAATHDALTGMCNRNSLWEFLESHRDELASYCVVMGDIDDFKKVNDTYGHECGDIILKSVVDIIMKNMTERDIACRWGGEEMLMVMCGTREECFARVSLIKSQINALGTVYDGKNVDVSMTFGFAASGESPDVLDASTEDESVFRSDIDKLISIVDKRLYKGKADGKNIIVA